MYDNTIKVILIIAIAILYLLPSLLAYARDIPHRQTVLVFNLILGWTGIGWIVCFLWATLAATRADEPA